MWMFEVVLDDGRSLHAYKHHVTRRYLHLDVECNAWEYQRRQGRPMYREVDLAYVLTEVFATWENLAFAPTAEERALVADVISAARDRGDAAATGGHGERDHRDRHIAHRPSPRARTPRTDQMTEPERRLESDLSALANRLRIDDAFAGELYCALCNSDWLHDDGTEWCGSWRYSAGLVAALRDLSECYLDFYCSSTQAEGTISERVASALAELGWRGTGHGRELRLVDLRTGQSKVWRDGEWVNPDDDAN